MWWKSANLNEYHQFSRYHISDKSAWRTKYCQELAHLSTLLTLKVDNRASTQRIIYSMNETERGAYILPNRIYLLDRLVERDLWFCKSIQQEMLTFFLLVYHKYSTSIRTTNLLLLLDICLQSMSFKPWTTFNGICWRLVHIGNMYIHVTLASFLNIVCHETRAILVDLAIISQEKTPTTRDHNVPVSWNVICPL